MQRKIVVFIAASLDGYIATREDALDWLQRTPGEGDNGYSAFLKTVDTILMGRRTYEWLLDQLGSEGFPYRDQACYVFSHAPLAPDDHVQFVQEPILPFVQHLRAQTGKDIWLVGGGGLIESFQAEDLIDEWIVTLAPTLLGEGIPLFQPHIGKQGWHCWMFANMGNLPLCTINENNSPSGCASERILTSKVNAATQNRHPNIGCRFCDMECGGDLVFRAVTSQVPSTC